MSNVHVLRPGDSWVDELGDAATELRDVDPGLSNTIDLARSFLAKNSLKNLPQRSIDHALSEAEYKLIDIFGDSSALAKSVHYLRQRIMQQPCADCGEPVRYHEAT